MNCIVVVFVALLPLPGGAAQTNWKLTTNGNFSVPANWDNGAPDSSKAADFGLGLGAATYTVTYNGAAIGFPPPQYQANQLIISGTNNVTFARNFLQTLAPGLTATSTDTTHATPGLMVGQFSGDNATLNDSVLTTVTEAVVANAQGSTGTLNVSGAGMNYSDLIIGYQGLGAMTISGSTHVTGSGGGGSCLIGYTGNAGNHGQLTVTGVGTTLSTQFIDVGFEGRENSMTISNGAQVSTVNTGYIARSAGSSATVVVDGTGSRWTGGFLMIGEQGTGAMEITDGAQVSDAEAIIGDNTGAVGTVTVDGAGSKWMAGGLSVGFEGSGTLYVTHGGQVISSAGALIAGGTSNLGTVIVDGAGTTWTQGGDLNVGNGTFSITGGGSVSTTGTANVGIAQFAISSVTVDGSGSIWSITGGLTLGSGIGTGTLTVRNAGLVSIGNPLTIAALGTLKGDGTISGAVSNGGVVAPGATIGALHISGSYTQAAAGTLRVELAGTTPGAQFDSLDVSGAVTLGGTLNVSLAGSFIPIAGNSFDILNWGSLSGTFSSVQLPGLNAGLQWNTSQLYTTGVLSVVSLAIPGDFNHNGIVDAADYVTWRKGLGTIYTQSDYDLWRAHFGQTAGAGTNITRAAVPEPTAAPLLLLSLFVLAANQSARFRSTEICAVIA